jgi:hypothetical protein
MHKSQGNGTLKMASSIPKEESKEDLFLKEQLKKEAADKKEADEKAMDLKKQIFNEQQEIKARNQKLILAKEKEQSERKYIPKKGTGKYFHVEIEKPQFNSIGEKVSQSTIQIMQPSVFDQWLGSASRLGYAWKLLHDASIFLGVTQKAEIKQSIEKYKEAANPQLVKYSSRM